MKQKGFIMLLPESSLTKKSERRRLAEVIKLASVRDVLRIKSEGRTGFTLIELIVVIAIFITIGLLVFASFRAGQRSNELRLAAQKLQADLSSLREKTLAGVVQSICLNSELGTVEGLCQDSQPCLTGDICTELPPEGGYGMHFNLDDLGSYIMFADVNANASFDTGEELRIVTLPENIRISAIFPSSPMDVVFGSIAPRVLVNGALENASIELKHTTTSKKRTVSVDYITAAINTGPEIILD